MKTKNVPLTSTPHMQTSGTKMIDYLHRHFPWKTREVIANVFQEAGANFTRTLKILSSSSAHGFKSQSTLAN